MGTSVACTLANLYLAFFEDKYVYSDTNPFLKHIKLFIRYVDDVLVVWDGTADDFTNFVQFLSDNNSMNMKFTSLYCNQSLEFLDVRISIEAGEINTEVYRKPTSYITSSNALLHFQSAHPFYTKQALPFSQFLRVKRINSTKGGFKRQSQMLYKRFENRGYPRPLLDAALNWAENEASCSTKPASHTNASNDKPFVFSFKYGPMDTYIRSIIRKNWHILGKDAELTDRLQRGPLFASRRSKNIGDILVRNRITTDHTNWLNKDTPKGNYKCGHCNLCTQHITGNTVQIGPIKHIVTDFISCKTTYTVYVIFCQCGFYYIGKTIRPLYIRIKEHFSSVRTGKGVPRLINHVRQCHAGNTHTLRFAGIARVYSPQQGGNLNQLLLRCEARWIMRTNATGPMGLNERIDMSVFL
ncbi:unnamed protein product [Ranitomeya imitator]|uniref:Helix-turn-helix domain-containing protein n=1 Tax=Ranitomeya imitator TaxID=111125 RepID=A0ABN9MEE9_9NEOB|nr:unnamed protein product [Ranitomeya imitator]